MKKIFFIFSFILGISALSQAQVTQKLPEQRAVHFTKVLQKRLNLNQDQASQINNIFLAQATRMDSLKSNRSSDRRLNGLTRRAIFLTAQKQVMAVLNDGQQKQFMAWQKMREEKAMHRKGRRQSPPQTSAPVQG